MTKQLWISLFVVFGFVRCTANQNTTATVTTQDTMTIDSTKIETAILAGGCFWCLDAVYRRMEGVITVESGYSQGKVLQPTYEDVCSGSTGHAEVVKITYDTSLTSYAEILEVFWRIHNPTTLNRQGNDMGTQYRSGIYYLNESQAEIAQKSKAAAEEAGLWEGKIVTEIEALNNYFSAEAYHQDYFTNNPNNSYCVYVVGEKVEKFKKLFADKLKK
jgi:peptide-methionine (S)-S-oxide reductase